MKISDINGADVVFSHYGDVADCFFADWEIGGTVFLATACYLTQEEFVAFVASIIV